MLCYKNSVLLIELLINYILFRLIYCDNNSTNFCDENFVDSAYFNGYDIIVTRDDWLWYYYKDKHNLSVPFSQESFTQGLYLTIYFIFHSVIYY